MYLEQEDVLTPPPRRRTPTESAPTANTFAGLHDVQPLLENELQGVGVQRETMVVHGLDVSQRRAGRSKAISIYHREKTAAVPLQVLQQTLHFD